MQHGADDTLCEADRFGLRRHGKVVAGTVTQPSGSTVSGINAYESTIAVSGKAPPFGPVDFDQAADVYIKNYAIVSFSETTHGCTLMGQDLGRDAVPFVAPSGRVWLVGQETGGAWLCSAASFNLTAKRFGVFGGGVLPSQHSISVSNPVSGDADLSSCGLFLADATPDGSKRIYRAQVSGIAYAWLEMTITEVSDTQLSASLSVIHSYAQTIGSRTSQAQTTTVGNGEWRLEVWKYVEIAQLQAAPALEKWELTPGNAVTMKTPVVTTDVMHGHTRVSGHVFMVNYDASGARVDAVLDVDMDIDSTSTIDVQTGGSGSLIIDEQPDHTYVGSGSVTVTGTSSEVKSGVGTMKATITRGAVVSAVNYTMSLQVSLSHDVVRSIGWGPSSSDPSIAFNVYVTGSDTYDQQYGTEEYKVDGVTVKAVVLPNSGTTVVPFSPIYLGVAHTPGSGFDVFSILAQHVHIVYQTNPGIGATPPPVAWMYGVLWLSGFTGAMHAKVARRSNSVFSFPGAVVLSGGSLDSAWDSKLIGRAGVLDPTRPSVPATYGASKVTWDLPTVSEQPVTGEWVRGASIAQDVGFV